MYDSKPTLNYQYFIIYSVQYKRPICARIPDISPDIRYPIWKTHIRYDSDIRYLKPCLFYMLLSYHFTLSPSLFADTSFCTHYHRLPLSLLTTPWLFISSKHLRHLKTLTPIPPNTLYLSHQQYIFLHNSTTSFWSIQLHLLPSHSFYLPSPNSLPLMLHLFFSAPSCPIFLCTLSSVSHFPFPWLPPPISTLEGDHPLWELNNGEITSFTRTTHNL